MRKFLKNLADSFANLIYPPACLHCNDGLDSHEQLFCSLCLALMVPIDPNERCAYCFSAEISEMLMCCNICRKQPPCTERVAAVFDYEGPAATLVKQMKYGGLSYLAEGGGAYLAMQLLKLDWPLPDLIIPMPMPSLRRLERGYNQSALLAESLGRLIERPVKSVIKRHNGDYSQAGLNHQQRLQLKSDRFKVLNNTKLYDQNILIIDDVMTTGRSLNCCAEALAETCPAKIYALTLCRAL